MVGVDTVIQDDPSLTTRIEGFNGRDPRRFILDTHLRTPEKSRILHLESDSDTFIVCGEDVSLDPVLSEKKERLEKTGVKIIEAPLKNQRIDLEGLMVILGGMNISSLLIEGGSRVLSSALQDGIVDKIFGFYATKILGGDDGVPLLRGPGPELMKDAISFKNVSIRRFEDDFMIEAYTSPVKQ
jgi:diaminohydroxyphosphoribosylaminopyrimidine deaminase/5-amino-6-(5-phosphoribosylamino)uracil reductase